MINTLALCLVLTLSTDYPISDFTYSQCNYPEFNYVTAFVDGEAFPNYKVADAKNGYVIYAEITMVPGAIFAPKVTWKTKFGKVKIMFTSDAARRIYLEKHGKRL